VPELRRARRIPIAASAFAVCSFCQAAPSSARATACARPAKAPNSSTTISPLQLGAARQVPGSGFTLVGRLQYRYNEGTWNEWHALLRQRAQRLAVGGQRPLRDGLRRPAAQRRGRPAASLQRGHAQIVNGQASVVASVTVAKLIAAQGETAARRPRRSAAFVVADLRSTRGEVGTLDYSDAKAPTWSVGRPWRSDELRDERPGRLAGEDLEGPRVECPSCGASLEGHARDQRSPSSATNATAVVDVSQGVGGEIKHYAQQNGLEPQIPLGRVGTLTLTRNTAAALAGGGLCRTVRSAREFRRRKRASGASTCSTNRTKASPSSSDAEDGWSWTRRSPACPRRQAAA
jgi:hypothetical protein